VKIIKLCIFLSLSVWLAGCSPPSQTLRDKPESETTGYQLGEGDAVNILVYGEPEMTM
jgi:hypothetical protein